MSIKRYFPAIGTAGFALSFVNGYRRDPSPPPITTAMMLSKDFISSSFYTTHDFYDLNSMVFFLILSIQESVSQDAIFIYPRVQSTQTNGIFNAKDF